MSNIFGFPPVYSENKHKIDKEKKTQDKETEIAQETITHTDTESKKDSSWWNWSKETAGAFLGSILGMKETVDFVTTTVLNVTTYSFNPTALINDAKEKMTTQTKDSELQHIIGFIGKKTSTTLWPTYKETIQDIIKTYVPTTFVTSVLDFIDVNSEYLGRIIEANVVSILGNLSMKYATPPLDPKLKEIIDTEIERMMNAMGPFSESAKQAIIKEGLEKIKDAFTKVLCPDGIENLSETDPIRLSLEEIGKIVEDLPTSLSEKINQAITDKEKRSQILSEITREIFIDPLPPRDSYSALPDLINHLVKTIKDKVDKAKEEGDKADLKAIVKEFTDEIIDAALPNGMDSVLLPDMGGVVHKIINANFPISALKEMVADLLYKVVVEKRDVSSLMESLGLPKELTDLILPSIKRSLKEEESGSLLDISGTLLNSLTNPVMEEKKNRELLGEELSKQCDQWTEELMAKMEDPLISGIVATLVGEGTKKEDQETRLQLENQLKVLLKGQDASTSQDGSLAWGIKDHIRANLIKVMAQIKQKSSDSDSPLLFGSEVLTKAIKNTIGKAIEQTKELAKTEKEIDLKQNKINELEHKLETEGADSDSIKQEIDKLRSDVMLLDIIKDTIVGENIVLTAEEKIALNPKKLREVEKIIQDRKEKLESLQQQLSEIDPIKLDQEIDAQMKELKELEGELAEIDKPNPTPSRQVAIQALKREIRELEVNIEFSRTQKQNEIPQLREKLANEIEDIELELFNLELERTHLDKISEGTKSLQKRFEGVSEGILSSIGWGEEDEMAIPFIRDILKNEILPSLLLDQTREMILLQSERSEIEEEIRSHHRGQGVLSLGKPISNLVLDIVKGAVVDTKEIVDDLCFCYNGLETSPEQQLQLEQSIETLLKEHPGKIKKKMLANIMARIDPHLKPNPERFQQLKEKMNGAFLSRNALGETIGDVITNEELLGMKLTGLSEEQKKSIGRQLQEFLSGKMPQEAWSFLGDHIELVVLKIFSNLGKKVAPEGQDILKAVAMKLKELSEKSIKEGKEPDLDKLTEEILALADIDQDTSLPGIPKALKSLLYGLAKDAVAQRLKDLYAHREFATNINLMHEIKESTRSKIERKGQSEEKQIKLDLFCEDLGELGTQVTFDILLKDRKDEGNIMNLLKGILPKEGATELGESLIDIWDTLTVGEKTKLNVGAKSHLQGLINAFSLEGMGNLFHSIMKETRLSNMIKMADFLRVVTDVFTEQPSPTKIEPKTRQETEREETTFFARLSSQIVKVLLPQGADSKALESIPKKDRPLVWTLLKTNIFPIVLKGVFDTFLSPAGLKKIWVSILRSVNANLAKVQKFDIKRAKLEAQQKAQKAQKKDLIKITDELTVSPEEQTLNEQAGEALIAITNKFAPGLLDHFLVRMVVPKDRIVGLVGSSLRGLVTDTFWTDMLQPMINTMGEERTLKPTGTQAREKPEDIVLEELNEQIKSEFKTALSLGWQAFHSILDNAIYQATGRIGLGSKHIIDKGIRMVVLTMIGTVMRALFNIQSDAIKEKLVSKGMDIVNFSVTLFDTEEKRRKLLGRITGIFLGEEL